MKEGKQDDEMLERLLAGLGAPPVEDGFVQRVTRGVEARTAAAEPRTRGWGGAIWGFASVAAAVLLCVAAVHALRGRDAAPRVRTMPVILPNSKPKGIDAVAVQEARIERVNAPRRREVAARRHSPPAPALVSFPAPEAPLTEQEKLLLGIARSGNPEELATLSPEIRARQEAKQKAAFHRVFEQGIPGYEDQVPVSQD
jgi:hypothetical protein